MHGAAATDVRPLRWLAGLSGSLASGVGASLADETQPLPVSLLGDKLLGFWRADRVSSGVDVLRDQTPGGRRPALQGAAARRPTLSSTSGPNSTPGLTFDGTDDAMDTDGSAGNLFALAGTYPGFWAVGRFLQTVVGSNHTLISLRTDAGTLGMRLELVQSDDDWAFQYHDGTTWQSTTGIANDTANHVFYFALDASAPVGEIDGVATSPAVSSTMALGENCKFVLGAADDSGSAAGNVVIAEAGVVSSKLTSAEYESLKAYWRARYGLTIA